MGETSELRLGHSESERSVRYPSEDGKQAVGNGNVELSPSPGYEWKRGSHAHVHS